MKSIREAGAPVATPAVAPAVRHLKSLLLGGLVVLSAAPTLAEAALIEFSVSGIVAQGTDEYGLFTRYDESNDAIVGRPYTMTLRVDTSTLSDYYTDTLHDARTTNTGAPPDFSGRVTIGSRSYDWRATGTGTFASLILGPEDHATMEGRGEVRSNTDLWASIGVFPYRPGQPYFDSLDFEQRIEFADFVDPNGYSAEFQFTYASPRYPDDHGGYVAHTNFVGTGTYALWRVVSPVPEPARYGMLLAGMGLVGAAVLGKRRG